MKTPPPVALLCAGNLTDSAVTRFQGLAARLGPVKSSSLRLASRFTNILRAGHPVNDYDAFRNCAVVLVAVPDAVVGDAIAELARAGLEWTRKSVVLCSTVLESEELKPLAELGAHTASLCEAAAFEGRLFLAEGNPAAIKQVSPLLEGRASKMLRLPAGHKRFYLAALACTGPMLTSLLMCAGECLKLAGVPATDAAGILQTQVERTTRSFLKAGRKGCPAPADLDRQIAALREQNPEVADFFQKSTKLARWRSKQV